MKVLAALDSFKGSLTSCQAGEAVRLGILRAIPAASVSVVPIADGGEGTTEALTEGLGGQYANVTVSDPLGRPITARYGLIQDGKTAVMEIASAAGLTLLCESERNPLHTATFLNEPLPLAEAMKEDIAAYNLESAAEQVFRLIDCFEGK